MNMFYTLLSCLVLASTANASSLVKIKCLDRWNRVELKLSLASPLLESSIAAWERPERKVRKVIQTSKNYVLAAVTQVGGLVQEVQVTLPMSILESKSGRKLRVTYSVHGEIASYHATTCVVE